MKESVKNIIKKNYQQVLFVFIAFLAMILVSYSYLSNIVAGLMLSLGEETMNTMQESVSGSLANSELVFSNVSQNVETMIKEGSSNEEILNYIVATNTYYYTRRSAMSDFLNLYAYIDDEFLDGSGWIPPDDYFPPNRPWHVGATRLGGRVYLSDPYVDADTGQMCITFSQQVFNADNDPVGIVALDIRLDRITDYVSSQRIVRDGYGILLDDKMNVVVHHNPDFIGHHLQEAGEGYALLANLMNAREPISAVRIQDSNGGDSVVFFRTIFNGWKLGIIIPRSSYYEQVISMGFVLIPLGLGLATILSYILVRTRVEKFRSEEASMSKSDFLARMSHEMRTPMNAVIGMTQIAKTADDPEKINYCLTKINNAANHLLGVINDVLDMSKVEAGKLELNNTEFLFQNMLSQVLSVIEIKIEEKEQTLTLNIDPHIPEVIVADHQRLAQVITNLISNANKFTPKGGKISLSIQRESVDHDKCLLKISVQDTGIGIPEEYHDRLFHSFEQADDSISRKYGGTGLGLAISKKIVTLMHGEIWLESNPEQGSCFTFTAQVGLGTTKTHEAKVDSSNEQSNYSNAFADKKILLAEDVEINQEIVLALLESTGIQIDCANNGKEATTLFMNEPDLYDAILMDVQMPEMDGYAATRMIRGLEVPKATTIPIIAMTANVFKEDIQQCLDSGMNDHIGKPINLDELLEKLWTYLRK